MVNKLRMLQWPLMAIMFACFCGVIIYSIEKEQHQCNQVVFLEGELSRDINYVDYLNHGNIARIHYCDGNVEDVPTSRIVKVVVK
jgi:hypothetical protein